jgi:hypothetical protein
MGWRSEARRALRDYPRIKRRQGDNEMQITPVYGGAAVQHSASRTTENVALRSTLTDREANVISAVEFAMQMQAQYYNAEARRKMVQLVYFRRTHTMQGAALECGYSIETCWKWNTELLAAVYVGLKKDAKNSTVSEPKNVI